MIPFLIFYCNLFFAIQITFQQLGRRIYDPIILQCLFCNILLSFLTIEVIGTRCLCIYRKFVSSGMVENTLQAVIGQIYRINCLCGFHQCFYIIAVFQNGLFHLLIISRQLKFFICTHLLTVVKFIKSKDEMMQSSICRIIYKKCRHSSITISRSHFTLIRKLCLLHRRAK